MIHLIKSISYLPVIALLLFMYVLLFRTLIIYTIQLVVSIRKRKFDKNTLIPQLKTIIPQSKDIFKYLVISLVVVIGLFVFERQRWIKQDSAYVDAKNYFVVGMVLMDLRTLGHVFFYPERVIWKPAVKLQEIISSSGKALIPRDDGEQGVWGYHFTLAPYINRIHAPETKDINKLIKTSEFVLDHLGWSNIKDPNFSRYNKYIIYPLVALYYSFSYKAKYISKPSPSRYYDGLFRDKIQVEFLKKIVDASVHMEQSSKEFDKVRMHIFERPELQLINLVSTALMAREILYYQIHNLEFTCDGKWLSIYYKYVDRYNTETSTLTGVDQDLKRSFDKALLYHGSRINFFGHALCGLPKLPAFNIDSVTDLKFEGPGWYESFEELSKALLPREK